MKRIVSVSILIFFAGFAAYRLNAQEEKKTETKHEGPVIKQSIVNLEYKGTKVWTPSFLIVPLGAKVELHLINNAPSGVHGFQIMDFGVKAEVDKGKTADVSFIADKAGLFPINCHLHPAHIGGQLLVVDLK